MESGALIGKVAMRRVILGLMGTAAAAGLLIATKLGVAAPTNPNAALADTGATAGAGGGPTGGTVVDATGAAAGATGGPTAARAGASAPAGSAASRKAQATTKAGAGGGGAGAGTTGGGGATTKAGGGGGGGGAAAGTGPKDGTFTGAAAAAGNYEMLTVTITISGGKLTAASGNPGQVNGTTAQIVGNALPKLQQEALAAQSANVATVSGATYTSGAYRTSLQSALDKAMA